MKNPILLFLLLLFYQSNAQELPTLNNLSIAQLDSMVEALYNEGRFSEAFPYALKNLEKTAKLPPSKERAKALTDIAYLHFLFSEYEEADAYYRQALEVNKKAFGERSQAYSSVLVDLSLSARGVYKYQDAELLLLEALDIEKNIDSTSYTYATTIGNLADLYTDMGAFEQAEPYYLKNIAMEEAIPNKKPIEYAATLNNFAKFYVMANRIEEAIPVFSRLLNAIENGLGKQHPFYGITLNNIAEARKKQKKYDEAEKLYTQAYESHIVNFGQHHSYTLTTINNIALLYLNWGKNEEAYNKIYKALAYNCRDKDSMLWQQDPRGFINAEFYDITLAQQSLRLLYYWGLKEPEHYGIEKGYRAMQACLGLGERMRNSPMDEGDKLRNLAKTGDMVAKTIPLAIQLNQQGDKEALKEAFTYTEQNKSVLLADALKAQRAARITDLPDSLAQKEADLAARYKSLEKSLVSAKEEATKNEIIALQNQWKFEQQGFVQLLRKEYPRYYALKYARTSTNADAIQQLLPEKTLWLQYFSADTATYLFALTKNNLDLFSLSVSDKILREKTGELRKALSDYNFIKKEEEAAQALYQNTAYWFYQQLLAPAIKETENIEHIIIVTDGELGHLPFEAFLTEQAQAESSYSELPYLLKKYTVSYNYSATLWKESMQNTVPANGKMLAVAAAYKGIDEEQLTRTNRAPHLRNLRDALNDLPAAKQEVEVLKSMFSGSFWQGEQSNEANFKANASQYGIIHLAMHGLLNQRAPILSSLAFTENGDSTEDNFLEAWEISQLRLQAQLVVLSACETGYGRFQQGEGIMSLGRAFMYAGVPSLVISLWQVNDASTSAIMQLFYQNLAKGMDKAKALRQAKLSYIAPTGISYATPLQAHPAFWAAFVLVGDSRPISIAAKRGTMLWWIVGGVAISVLGIGLLLRRRKEA